MRKFVIRLTRLTAVTLLLAAMTAPSRADDQTPPADEAATPPQTAVDPAAPDSPPEANDEKPADETESHGTTRTGARSRMIFTDTDGKQAVLFFDGLKFDLADIDLAEVLGDGSSGTHYWLGVGCDKMSELLRSHLGPHVELPEEAGLVVEQVFEESPADKAGIRNHDLLLRAGGKPLQTPEQLAELVQASGGEPLTLDVLRKGAPLELVVSPIKIEQEQPKRGESVPLEGRLELLEHELQRLTQSHVEQAHEAYQKAQSQLEQLQNRAIRQAEELEKLDRGSSGLRWYRGVRPGIILGPPVRVPGDGAGANERAESQLDRLEKQMERLSDQMSQLLDRVSALQGQIENPTDRRD
jgi:chaperonin cofactor prefoldin